MLVATDRGDEPARRRGASIAGSSGPVCRVPFNLIMIVSAVLLGPRFGVAAIAVGYVGSAARRWCASCAAGWSAVASALSEREDPASAISRLVPPLLLGVH
jgi:putative peptidoglycan lipid II flippase